jgi:hypothetical protein
VIAAMGLPRKFNEIIGQPEVIPALMSQLLRGEVSDLATAAWSLQPRVLFFRGFSAIEVHRWIVISARLLLILHRDGPLCAHGLANRLRTETGSPSPSVTQLEMLLHVLAQNSAVSQQPGAGCVEKELYVPSNRESSQIRQRMAFIVLRDSLWSVKKTD